MKNHLRYLFALLAAPLAVLLRFALMPLLGPGVPYITIFAVTAGVAVLGGVWPAVVTGILGSILTDYFFIPPLYTFETGIPFLSQMAVVVVTSAFVGYMGDALRKARDRAEKHAAESLESRADLRRAQEVGKMGNWRLNVRRNELVWSQENYRIFGVPAGTPMTYETFLATIHPDDRQYVDEKWTAALHGEPYDIEHRILADGEVKWVREKAELEVDNNGVLVGGFGITQDITGQKQAEEALRQSEEKHRNLFENMAEEVHFWRLVRDGDGRIETWRLVDANPPTLRTWGRRTIEEVRGKTTDEIFGAGATEHYRPVVEKIMTEGVPFSYEDYFPNLDKHFRFTSVPLGEYFITTGADITSIKKAELALRESEGRLRALAEAMPQIVWTADADGGVEWFNQRWYEYTGLPRGIGEGWSWDKVSHPDDMPQTLEKWRQACEQGTLFENEIRVGGRDGQYRWFLVRAWPMQDAEGKVTRWFGTNTDIDELRQAQDELEARVQERTSELSAEVLERRSAEQKATEERQRFYDVLETLPAYVCLLTPDYYMPFANKVFREWFGYRPDRKCHEFLFGRKEPCQDCHTYDVLKTDRPERWEWTGPNGHDYDIHDFPFKDTDGSQLILEMGIDITQQKQAQAALARSEERYRSLTVATTQVIWTTAADGQVVGDMPSWRAFTGQTADEMQGWGWINSLHPDDRERTAEVWSRSVRHRELYETEYRLRRHDGEYRYVTVRGVPVLQEDGSIREWVGVCTDITEKKAAEAELERYRLHLEDLVAQRTEELARSNKDLEQFAYVASHDLQEPLRAVAGFVELLKRNLHDSLDAKTTSYMDFAVDGAKRMQSLINGLLEYSRIGQGARNEETSSKAASDTAMAHLLTSIEESGAKVTVDELPVVRFDTILLVQLFQNLIGNAIKFRGKEPPRIHIGAARDGSGWRFAVSDNGIGIEPEYAERIFLIFQRLHDRDRYPGMGIGLAICKRIVERHNGKIWVESRPGQGSTFYFTVPDEGSR